VNMRVALFLSLLAVACGGKTTTATTPAPATNGSTAADNNDDDDPPPPSSSAVAEAAAAPPVTAADGSTVLENLIKKETPASAFPKATTTDAACSKGIGYTGASLKDYPELAKQCGTGTGMNEFVKPVVGKLGPGHPHDVYAFKMLGGFCYRFFAVGDDSLQGIKIRVQRPEGALLSMAASKSFVAIMNPDNTWCKNKDREFRLVVETNGGQGSYKFGVWARPKS
jgi:hypothetical protein